MLTPERGTAQLVERKVCLQPDRLRLQPDHLIVVAVVVLYHILRDINLRRAHRCAEGD